MIINFLIDSRYGGPQMIKNHLEKVLKSKFPSIYFDRKNKNYNFSNLKKKNKLFYFFDVLINFYKLYLKRKKFRNNQIFFVFSILNIVPIILGIFLKKKIIWYILEKPDTGSYFVFKILYALGKIEVICISDSLGKILKLKNYYVYFPSIDINFWKNQYKSKKVNSELKLICVGNINKTKNHLNLIILLQKLKINYQLNIIGKKINTQKKYFKQLNYLIKKINKLKKIKIKIYQNKQKKFIKKYLGKSDFFILPSKSEGLSIALVEAMSMNLICLVSKSSNHAKLIINNKNGFEFNLNIKSFSKVINKIKNLSYIEKKYISKNARISANKLIKKNKIFENNFKSIFFSNL